MLRLVSALLAVWLMVVGVSANYYCVCSQDVAAVQAHPNPQSGVIGYIYTSECKPLGKDLTNPYYYLVMYEGKIGYIESNQVEVQICAGNISPVDLVTTSAPHHTTTLPTPEMTKPSPTTANPTQTTTPTTTTTPTPSTTPTTTSSTESTTRTTTTSQTTPTTTSTTESTTRTTTTSQTTPTTTSTTESTTRTTTTSATTLTTTPKPSVLEGRTDLCPDSVTGPTHTLHTNGYIGQYGHYCYEVVANRSTQMAMAEANCRLVPGGHLVSIVSSMEQSYILRLLAQVGVNEPIWLGLTDSGTTSEGKWRWTSEEHFSYHNFGAEYNQHSDFTHRNDDCVILKPGGEWTDVPCGISFALGLGTGEHHPWICQYKVAEENLPTVHPNLGVLVG